VLAYRMLLWYHCDANVWGRVINEDQKTVVFGFTLVVLAICAVIVFFAIS
jgi:hypothetical protein